jgi:isocitrate dehydrogenase kinase/phosphatase
MNAQRLDSALAYDIAQAMMDGFNRHYSLFRSESAQAKHRYETQDWHGQQRAQRERIEFYDLRVKECSSRLETEFKAGEQASEVWQQVKLHYIGLLVDHFQPELAETFFNSVTTKILDRSYFQNDFIFVRPAVSTEYIENSEPDAKPTYKAWYPSENNLHEVIVRMVRHFDLQCPFENLERDADDILRNVKQRLGQAKLRANFQVQVSVEFVFQKQRRLHRRQGHQWFSRNPVRLAGACTTVQGQLVIDAALFGEDDMLMLFSFARAYFLVDMDMCLRPTCSFCAA